MTLYPAALLNSVLSLRRLFGYILWDVLHSPSCHQQTEVTLFVLSQSYWAFHFLLSLALTRTLGHSGVGADIPALFLAQRTCGVDLHPLLGRKETGACSARWCSRAALPATWSNCYLWPQLVLLASQEWVKTERYKRHFLQRYV